ncbi:MAG: hypothetical protein ACSHWN_11400 [Methylophilaceae bacterium]
MKPINLTHTLHQPQKHRFTIMLFYIGLLVFTVSMAFLLNSNNKLAALERQKEEQLILSKVTEKPKLNDQQLAELSAVNTAIRNLVRPWPILFKGLESARLDGINLLSVEPNVKNQTFHITAVAFSIDSMEAYIKRLNQQEMSQLVNLVSIQALQVEGQDAMQFELLLKW